MDLKDSQGSFRQQNYSLLVYMLERVNMMFHTSFLDQDNIPHILHEKTNHSLKQWLWPLIQSDRTASSFSRIFFIGVKFAWSSQTHHRSRSIKTIIRLWHFEINY